MPKIGHKFTSSLTITPTQSTKDVIRSIRDSIIERARKRPKQIRTNDYQASGLKNDLTIVMASNCQRY